MEKIVYSEVHTDCAQYYNVMVFIYIENVKPAQAM